MTTLARFSYRLDARVALQAWRSHTDYLILAFLTIPETEEPYLIGLPPADVARIYKGTEDLVRVRRE